jgi:hypothetical protein
MSAGAATRAAPPRRMRSAYAFLAFFFALFLLITPFELTGGDGSMFPKFLSAGLALALAGPLLLITPIRLQVPSLLLFVVLLTIVLHLAVVKPGPPQYILLICANFAVAIVLYETSFHWRRQFEAALSCLLIINIVMIALQAALFYLVSSTIIDFHKAIFGSPSRFVEDYLNIARFSGLQV